MLMMLPCCRLTTFILIILCVHLQSTYGTRKSRLLYDVALEDNLALKVQTYSTILDPVGITVGEYSHTKGLFVSSFGTNSISFISLEHQGHTKEMQAVTISGGVYDIDSDGTFDTASFAEPSRLAYDKQCHLLFVVCKKNRVVRVMNFNDQTVKTLQTNQDKVVTFESDNQYQLNVPGFDIQSVAGDSLYVTDTSMLYRVVVSGHDSFCESIATAATLIHYQSLSYYMQLYDYPSNARIFSVLPDEGSSSLFVAIGEGKNVILKVPMGAVYSNQYSQIIKVVGNEGLSWNGLTNIQTPPVATNGVASMHSATAVTLAFPMHLQKDKNTGFLFWTECYPYAGDFLLGSLTIRRIDLESGLVDFYAGSDFSQDTETYLDVGTEGGYNNDIASAASFRYPISMAYYSDDVHAGGQRGEGTIYVVDKNNHAIRRVAVVVDTAAPTSVYINPIPSSVPSKTPTQQPTLSLVPTLTFNPTSSQPTLSLVPTSNPSKRPTRRPTVKPTTLEPTSASVWIQDNSLFNTMGLGTVHVGVWMYLGSIFVGVLLSSLVVLAYTQRHRNPHRQLRTTENLHLDEYDDTHEYYIRKCRFTGHYLVYLMGVCIPGSAFYESNTDVREHEGAGGGNVQHSGQLAYAELSSGISRLWRSVRAVIQSVSSRDDSNEDSEGDTPSSSSSGGIQNILQSVRDSSSAEQRRHSSSANTSSSYAHTSMSPQEYRELTPREQESGSGGYSLDSSERSSSGLDMDIDMDESGRSSTPMIVRTFGSSYDGL